MESKRKEIFERRQLKDNTSAFTTPIEGAMVVVATISLMMIGAFFAGILKINLFNSLKNTGTDGNAARRIMNNSSQFLDSGYGILNVNLIIYILGGSLAIIFAIFAGTRMRQG